jgi:aerobic-type carbon monoxide dehydrogenase small subunit (CoxS/CutS family)
MMLGGVICGYCATGNVHTATAPAKVMMMDITEAKIGRSIKKRANIGRE